MKKIHLIILSISLVLTGLIFMAIMVLRPWLSKPGTVKMTTQIKVYEGSVNVYRFDEINNPVFLRQLNQGESTEVTQEKRVYGDGGVFGFLSSLMSKAVMSIMDDIEQRARTISKYEFVQVFNEDYFSRYFKKTLSGKVPLSEIAVTLRTNGFQVSARLKRKFVDVQIAGEGVLFIEWNDRLCLKLTDVHVGPMSVPGFILRQLEDVFYNASNNEDKTLRIRGIKFQHNAIQFSCRKIDRALRRSPV